MSEPHPEKPRKKRKTIWLGHGVKVKPMKRRNWANPTPRIRFTAPQA